MERFPRTTESVYPKSSTGVNAHTGQVAPRFRQTRYKAGVLAYDLDRDNGDPE